MPSVLQRRHAGVRAAAPGLRASLSCAAAVLALAALPWWLAGPALFAAQALAAATALALAGWQGHRLLALRRSEHGLRQASMVFDNTRDGVVITDARGRIEAVNPAFIAITGYRADEAIGRTPALLKSGRQGADFYRALWRSLLEHGTWQGEIWNRRKSGEVYPEWLTISAVRAANGAIAHYVGVFTDVSRIRRSEAELEHLAHYDPLTDLPNRRLVSLRLGHAVERAQRHDEKLAVLYIDLDGFKTVNDSLGHPAGDELLVAVAQRLKTRLREEDTLGRLGGDEFLVLLEGVAGGEAAAVVARDLLAAVKHPARLAGCSEAHVSASIGISIYPDDGATPTELLRNADAAMYRAKDQGRNRLCFYTADMNVAAVGKLELEAALWRAIERDELDLHYQPKVDSASGRIVGAEALVRWRRDGALVLPGEFVPFAEKSGLIVALGQWVTDRVCRQLRSWADAGFAPVPVAVNVSAREFVAGDLDAVLADTLRRHGVAPALLQIELTESMLMERPEEAVATLHRLAALGIRVSLDDFGTGSSSLSYLHRFAVDALKIDRSFVERIGHEPDGASIVDAIVELAHRVGVRVIAEGVETAAQATHLVRQGCDEMQGFHHARPMPADALQALLESAETVG